MRLGTVGGVIAVANRDTAMPLLQVGAIPIIERIVITYQQVGIFPVVVVTDVEDEEIRRQVAGYGVVFLSGSDGAEPELLDAARIGLRYLQDKCQRIVYTPVNVPMFSPVTLTELLEREGEIIVPSYEGHGGHPVVLNQSVLRELLDYRGENGLRGAMADSGLSRTWVDVTDKGVITNVRNEEELRQQLACHNTDILHPVIHMTLEKEAAFFSARQKLLLYLLEDTQNMRTACACCGVAHSKAWDMINRLEQNLGYSVVERHRGGKSGGSTRLTEEGRRFLMAYHDLEQAVHRFTQEEFKKLFVSTKIL